MNNFVQPGMPPTMPDPTGGQIPPGMPMGQPPMGGPPGMGGQIPPQLLAQLAAMMQQSHTPPNSLRGKAKSKLKSHPSKPANKSAAKPAKKGK